MSDSSPALRVSHGAKENPRRNVIDKLPWTAFCWNEGVIRIQATEFFRPKSHESEGDVLVDPELLELFRSFYACRKSEFVIESKQHPKHTATFGRYRCQDDIRALIGWLRARIASFPGHRSTRCARTVARSTLDTD